jgi:hypothetical protein
MRRLLYIALTGVIAITAACSGKDDTSANVPRRKAYPRIEAYDSAYTRCDSLFVSFDANSAAVVHVKPSGESAIECADIVYPRYGMTVYLTAIRSDKKNFERRLDDRLERISLNLGGAYPTAIDVKSAGGYDATVFVCPGINTPVQALAADSVSSTLVSATLFCDATIMASDSIAPMVEVITRDISQMMRSLTLKP